MLALEKRNKYKADKKIQKEIEKKQKQIEKHRLSIQRKNKLALEKKKEELSIKAEKKLSSITKKKQRELDTFIRAQKWLKPLKAKPSKISKIKAEAFALVQKYARMLRADEDGMVTLLDTGERVHWTKAYWWHLRPKFNYPQLAFEIDNIRPISGGGNWRQLDHYGEERADKVEREIGSLSFERLRKLSKNQYCKNQKRDVSYYELKIVEWDYMVKNLLIEKPYLINK